MRRIILWLLSITITFMLSVPQSSTASEVPEFIGMNDPRLIPYIENSIYDNLVTTLNSDGYFVENIEAVYVSHEYLEELAYNTKTNIFFGYSLDELEQQFQGKRYVFSLSDDGQTTVQPFEEYNNTLETVIRNVAIGTGVILVCVTVSVITAGTGAAAINMIFACAAKGGAIGALSGGVLGGVSAGIVKGIQTGDVDAALEASLVAGSDAFKWGAITGVLSGGATEAFALKGAARNGLTINQAAAIQKESGLPFDVIKEFQSIEQYRTVKDVGFSKKIVNGRTTLFRDLSKEIDMNAVDEFGFTNLQRMKNGNPPLDTTGIPYELHHVGQVNDGTIAMLTRAEHRLENNHKIWHQITENSPVNRGFDWEQFKKKFWKEIATLFGGIV